MLVPKTDREHAGCSSSITLHTSEELKEEKTIGSECETSHLSV